VMRVGRPADGRLDLAAALRLLGIRGITRVFSEGGPVVGEALAAAGLADRVIISTADHRLGTVGVLAVRPALAATIGNPALYSPPETVRHGSDVFATYERTL
jgi:diaminohydroxyphosphoribosylaminopyrimidine deaminase / 5-amino-6-(5-phosphoribosylamino)uracil reductase